MAHRRRLALIAVLAALVAAGLAAANTVEVRADVTFTKRGYEYLSVRLSIAREEKTFTLPLGTTSFYIRPKVTVRDLDADDEPEVWVDTYTGGAHCCLESRFFRYLPSRRTYARTFHGWADIGYRAKNLDGRGHVELVSADARFAYAFTSFADSFFPLRIWQFEAGRIRDVTRLFPGQVDLDGKQLWRTYLERRSKRDVRGVLAAWLADQYVLGREDDGWRALEAAARRRELGGDLAPTGRAYLRALRAYLVKLGYA